MQMLLVLINRDAHATLCNVTGRPRPFRQSLWVLVLRELLASGAHAAPVFGTLTHTFVMDVLKQGRRYAIALLAEMVMRVQLVMATDYGRRVLSVELAAVIVIDAGVRRKEHGPAPIRIHMHHVIVNVTATSVHLLVRQNGGVVTSITIAGLASIFPATGARHGEVVDLARAVLPSGQHVTHAGLVDIEPAQLRYLALVLLSFVELDVLSGRFDALLEGELLSHLRLLLQVVLCLPLLTLRWLWLLDLTGARHEPALLLFGLRWHR